LTSARAHLRRQEEESARRHQEEAEIKAADERAKIEETRERLRGIARSRPGSEEFADLWMKNHHPALGDARGIA
jgi:hypothetical protein